jgi:hypothetical protein
MILISAGVILNSCYYDIQEELHPGLVQETCDTTNITFSGKVTDILRLNCFSCHSQSVNSGNISLDNYAGVKAVADNGRLLGSIEHQPGFLKMPQNLPQLSACDRSIIKIWIQNGSTND